MWKHFIIWLVCGSLLLISGSLAALGEGEDALAAAARLANNGDTSAALRLLAEHFRETPDDLSALLLQADIHTKLRDHKATIADCDKLIAIAPDQAASWLNRRGAARFKDGDIAGSIADFDRAIQRQPQLERSHWQRGLSYFYDGQFAAGARQFELYQTYDAADVENVVWRFLCQMRVDGTDKARREMLQLDGRDRRIPMMAVDALYRGKSKVEDVFAAAERGNPTADALKHRNFYAHLYVGLYLEAMGKRDDARRHILAADKLKIDHYMWDVAHVHAERLENSAQDK